MLRDSLRSPDPTTILVTGTMVAIMAIDPDRHEYPVGAQLLESFFDVDIAEITASAPLINRYKKTLSTFVEGTREFCNRRGMNYLLANQQMPVEQLIASYLRKRGMVR